MILMLIYCFAKAMGILKWINMYSMKENLSWIACEKREEKDAYNGILEGNVSAIFFGGGGDPVFIR